MPTWWIYPWSLSHLAPALHAHEISWLCCEEMEALCSSHMDIEAARPPQ